MQSSRGLCYSSWERRKVAYFLPAQLTENVANLFSSRFTAEMQVGDGWQWLNAVRTWKAPVWIHLYNQLGTRPWTWRNSRALCEGLGFRPCDTVRCEGSTRLPGTKPEAWKCISLHMQLSFLLILEKKHHIQDISNRSLVLASRKRKKKAATKHFSS